MMKVAGANPCPELLMERLNDILSESAIECLPPAKKKKQVKVTRYKWSQNLKLHIQASTRAMQARRRDK